MGMLYGSEGGEAIRLGLDFGRKNPKFDRAC
jgi:hypothetical protein